MTIEELNKTGSKVFKLIEVARVFPDATNTHYALNQPQPPEWVIEKKSRLTGNKYQTNKIGMIELLMVRVFGGYEKEILSTTISQDRNKFAATVSVKISYRGLSGKMEYQWGVATAVVNSIELLEMATPVAASRSFRNACKYIGDLFGKSLNRDVEEDDELETIQIKKELEIDEDFENFKVRLTKINFREQAEAFIDGSEYKHLRKSNQEIKKIIESKPSNKS